MDENEKISRYENVDMDIKDGILTIKVCVDETKVNVLPSASGKSVVIATTGGAQRVGFFKVNLTVYRKA